jgi:hypothetical protein
LPPSSPDTRDPHFSEALCAFIQDTLPTVDAVEILLFLHRHSGRHWSQDDLVREMNPAAIARPAVARHLDLFQARGLVSLENAKYAYSPATPALAALVDALDTAYKERPVSLVRLIYFLRDHRIQSFADAFRMQKE